MIKNKNNQNSLSVFIEGEIVNLKVPDENFVENSNWYNFLNSKRNTRFLEHGVYPNNLTKQKEFYLNLQKDNRIVLLIFDKEENFLGIISLSFINLERKSADISIVINMDNKIGYVNKNFLIALESIALMTEHGFEKLGLERISATQVEDLYKWQNLMELTGFKIEGICRDKFIKGLEKKNCMMISSIKTDYLRLKKSRNKLWDGKDKMMQRIKSLPKVNSYSMCLDFFKKLEKNYYNKIFLDK